MMRLRRIDVCKLRHGGRKEPGGIARGGDASALSLSLGD